jgi:hypothetical protein
VTGALLLNQSPITVAFQGRAQGTVVDLQAQGGSGQGGTTTSDEGLEAMSTMASKETRTSR